jgi:transposase-like protein
MAAVDRERWVKLVADFEASDLSQREFSNQRGISFSILRYWIYQMRKEARPLAPEETAPKKRRLNLRPVRRCRPC